MSEPVAVPISTAVSATPAAAAPIGAAHTAVAAADGGGAAETKPR